MVKSELVFVICLHNYGNLTFVKIIEIGKGWFRLCTLIKSNISSNAPIPINMWFHMLTVETIIKQLYDITISTPCWPLVITPHYHSCPITSLILVRVNCKKCQHACIYLFISSYFYFFLIQPCALNKYPIIAKSFK